ncbi:hypothetical protein PCH_Pc22g21320 [Penicillium rubens Wisconsin 54-1255]|uniref:Uncharacterized protein n=1 Tax=Penicillium rubens (strain ATCC 28089 / DSM 1075 / NRRL 1951 / Wisconsin 54-1255) TaxID=500485 RepID=B6HSG8_PENRW|nr:hypothetical protein PCH_Pc22g21320 [Penicillium rubens Wisconsin 54-1255]
MVPLSPGSTVCRPDFENWPVQQQVDHVYTEGTYLDTYLGSPGGACQRHIYRGPPSDHEPPSVLSHGVYAAAYPWTSLPSKVTYICTHLDSDSPGPFFSLPFES